MNKPRFTKEEEIILDEILGKTNYDFSKEKEGYIYFTCPCGQIEHQESLVDGKKSVVCSTCGSVYYTLTSIKEREEQDRSN